MCDVVTALTVAAGVASAGGQIQAAQSSAAMQRYNAAIADQNATLAGQEAFARQQRIRAEGERVLAAQAAAFGKAGAAPGTGTPLLVAMGTAADVADDEQLAGWQGDVEAYSYRNQAAGLRAGAKSTLTQGYIGAGASLLSSGAKVWAGLDKVPGYGATGRGQTIYGGYGRQVGGV